MNVSMQDLIYAGAHFGHRTRFWNPKMEPFLYQKPDAKSPLVYNRTHVINLDKTVAALHRAGRFFEDVGATGGTALYVCAKGSGAEIVREEAQKAEMPFVDHRWLGGLLTNFKTTLSSVARLRGIEESIAAGALDNLTKKEGLKLIGRKEKLERAIGGVREMKKLPDALFVVDVGWHKGAVREANKLGIPVAGVVDTNCSPDGVDFLIPGNDDSKDAIRIYASAVTESIMAGRERRAAEARDAAAAEAEGGLRS